MAYLLQRIEDFPGTIVLATNLRSNIDEAFSRRFQSLVYFPMPDEYTRYQLWDKMLPANWLLDREACIRKIADYELSGGAMTNVIRSCAIHMMMAQASTLDETILINAIRHEQIKEGVR